MMAVQNELLQEGKPVALTRLCRWLELPRSTAYYQAQQRSTPRRDHAFEMLVFDIVQEHPTFGIRRVWALLKFSLGWNVNRKRVARLFKRRGWSCKLRRIGGRPRVQASKSRTERPDQRWATDIASVWCGENDGWCSIVPVIDCCTRQVLGWELAPVIARWIAWYNSGRPHQALKYKITGCRSRAAEDGRGLGKRQNGVVHHLSHEEKRPEPFNSAGRRPRLYGDKW